MDNRSLKLTPEEIKAKASALGFELTGIAPIRAFSEANFYKDWLDRGLAAHACALPVMSMCHRLGRQHGT